MSVSCRVAVVFVLVVVPHTKSNFDSQAFAEELDGAVEARPAASEAELKYWLENMVRFHGFSVDETASATGLPADDVRTKLKAFAIKPESQKNRESLLVLPWPSGRHPRIGFLEGAILPQRETKVSVFTPWGDHDFVVVDVPEAIWSNLGLTYLAHTHIPTVFDKQGATLKKLEWNRHADGTLDIERVLPNGIRFGAVVRPKKDHVQMELWLKNGTPDLLTDLRVQNCVMLKSASGFNTQTNDNKQSEGPYALARSTDGNRWIITAWEPLHRTWYNEQCPCLHSDPKFPDCKPGKTVRLNGWLSFYAGKDIDSEVERIGQLRRLASN
jgi:hypothetical protein